MQQKFRTGLLLAGAALVLVLASTVVIALVSLRSIGQRVEQSQQVQERLASIEQLRRDARELARSGRRALLDRDVKEQQRVAELEAQIGKDRERIAAGARTELRPLETAIEKYVSVIVRAMSLETTEGAAVKLAHFEDDLTDARSTLGASIDELVTRERSQIDTSRSTQRLLTWAQWALLLSACTGLVLVVGSLIAVNRRLSSDRRALQSATAVAERAATARKELLAASTQLRSPLASIQASSRLLLARARDEEERRELQATSAAAARVDHLLAELLDVSAVQAGTLTLHREPCEAMTLIDNAISSHRDAARKRGIRFRVEAREISVCVDRRRVERALSTLLGLALAGARVGAEIVASATPSEDGVRFVVSDASPSAVPQGLAHVFESLARAPTDRDLGLHLCKRVIEAHGGRVGVEAAAVGHLYWFTLPTEPKLLT